MRISYVVLGTMLLLLATHAGDAAADFAGFSSIDARYGLTKGGVKVSVTQGSFSLCQPLAITAAKAQGRPGCEPASAADVAAARLERGKPQVGAGAEFRASMAMAALEVTNAAGQVVVRWAPGTLVEKVTAVELSKHRDRLAVLYQVSRLGVPVEEVVVFGLLVPPPSQVALPSPAPIAPTPGAPAPAAPATAAMPALSDATQGLMAKAQKAKGKQALVEWEAVLAQAPDAHRAYLEVAARHAKRDPAKAIEVLARLAARKQHGDAIEWLVAARYAPALRGLIADPGFRAVVGLGEGFGSPYERVMGLGGHWEQSGTACASPTVVATFTQAREVSLHVTSACEGAKQTLRFKGSWQVDGNGEVGLTLPNSDGPPDQIRCTFEARGDEEALRCPLDAELEFTVLPIRR